MTKIDEIVEEIERIALSARGGHREQLRRILRTALLKAKLEEVEEMIHPSDRPRSYGSFLSYADARIAKLRAQIKEATDVD